jgi:hypothetical protein
MATLQILRGSAPLPEDLDERFRRAFGREMTVEEREFLGVEPEDDRRTSEPLRNAA